MTEQERERLMKHRFKVLAANNRLYELWVEFQHLEADFLNMLTASEGEEKEPPHE